MADSTKTNGQKPQKAKRPPFHEEFASKIIERLQEGTAPWQIPWTPGQTTLAPHNPASGTVYRGMNRVHLALSGYDDPRWMTLKQANEQGYSILPGSKATPVVYFQFTDEKNKLDNDGKPVLGADGKPEKEKVELDKPIVRFAHVFNAEQVDGIPPLQLTDKAYEWEPIEKAENILAASGAEIKHDQSNRAFYRRMEDAIHLPPKENFDAPDKYYATALHELGHWTGDENRLNREFGPFGSEKYAREELRAEIASWMLGQEIGIGHDPGQHAAYVQSWIQVLKEDPYEIVRACRDAEKIKDYVFDMERKKELRQEAPEQVVQPEKVNQREKSLEKEEGIAAMGVPTAPAKEKTFLAVPYKEKEQAKKFGAKWDKENKLWYAPEGTDLTPLAAWMPEKAPVPEPSMPPQEEFANALEQAGLDLRGKAPIMDGQIHRVPLIGRNGGDLDGAYCGYLDERPAGWMQNFSAGEKTTWVATGHTLTKEQLEAQRAEIARKREERQRLILEQQHKTAREAHTEWIAHDWASADNPYLQAKGVQPFGVREDLDGTLLVPVMTVDKELRGLQTIYPEGEKRFMYGMEKNGNFHMIADPDKDLSKDLAQGEIILAEGYATGATLHMATEKPVAVAFDAGNLEPVAKKLREKFPNAAITICADNDHKHTRKTPDGVEHWNKGVELAQRAAQEVGGKVVAPIFTDEERAKGLTDFNDLHQSRGLDEVKRQVGLVLQKDVEREKGRNRGKARELSL
ncbi:zincin-like metallopeptidase domain-containing protein [Bilophila wadsworthia]|uniref:zincin-like metallopeptidase domain-containing protein n=1 Tax=Bilophila wadsworthia TaxID=35833 RepID=UPI003AB1A954